MLDRIALITGNAGKAAEYAAMLGIDVTPAKAELSEVQSLDVAVVARKTYCVDRTWFESSTSARLTRT